jgi:hypothetical protein
METELTFRIVLEKPPAGVDFGLQKGSGRDYETIQKQRSTGKDLRFDVNVRIKNSADSNPVFLGPFVQGTPRDRFIYIDIGTYAGQSDSKWSRKLKIPLSGITLETLQKLKANAPGVLEARVQGTGKDGGPTCATVKPFNGWKLVN